MTVLQMVVIQERGIKKVSFYIFKSFLILNPINIVISIVVKANNEVKIENGTAKIIKKCINSRGKYNLIFMIELVRIDYKINGSEADYAFGVEFTADSLDYLLVVKTFNYLLGVTRSEFYELFTNHVVVRT